MYAIRWLIWNPVLTSFLLSVKSRRSSGKERGGKEEHGSQRFPPIGRCSMSPPWPPWREQKSCPVSHSSALCILHSGQVKISPASSNKPLLHAQAHATFALQGTFGSYVQRAWPSEGDAHGVPELHPLTHARRCLPCHIHESSPLHLHSGCQSQGQEKAREMQNPTVSTEKYIQKTVALHRTIYPFKGTRSED